MNGVRPRTRMRAHKNWGDSRIVFSSVVVTNTIVIFSTIVCRDYSQGKYQPCRYKKKGVVGISHWEILDVTVLTLPWLLRKFRWTVTDPGDSPSVVKILRLDMGGGEWPVLVVGSDSISPCVGEKTRGVLEKNFFYHRWNDGRFSNFFRRRSFVKFEISFSITSDLTLIHRVSDNEWSSESQGGTETMIKRSLSLGGPLQRCEDYSTKILSTEPDQGSETAVRGPELGV